MGVGAARCHCEEVHVCYLISWWVLVVLGYNGIYDLAKGFTNQERTQGICKGIYSFKIAKIWLNNRRRKCC